MARMPDRVVFTPLGCNKCGRGLLVVALALLAIGVVAVHSAMASVSTVGQWYSRLDVRHTLFAVAAGVVLISAWLIDYRWLAGKSRRFPVVAGVLLGLSLVCGGLVFVPGIGHSVNGCARWIRLGPPQFALGFQPSEMIKISLVVFLAAWLSRKDVDVRSFRETFVPAMVLISFCVGLVVSQDFGMAVLIGIAGATTLLVAGVPMGHMLMLTGPAAAGVYFFLLRSPHRMARITAMFDIWSADNPSAYQPRQSMLAILTGGWTGKGLGNGSLKLGFLPEDTTDFIYSALCEEWGLIGAILVLGLFVLWIGYAWQIALDASDRFGQLLAGSLGFLVAAQALMHIAVDTVVLPPTGISLPFISAGGTSLVLMAGAASLIISVSARQKVEGPVA